LDTGWLNADCPNPVGFAIEVGPITIAATLIGCPAEALVKSVVGSVAPLSVHAALEALTAIVVTLLEVPPLVTVTGMLHPLATAAGMVKEI